MAPGNMLSVTHRFAVRERVLRSLMDALACNTSGHLGPLC